MPAKSNSKEKALSPFGKSKPHTNEERERMRSIHIRFTSYCFVGLSFIALGWILHYTPWSGDASIFISLEFIAASYALIIGAMSLIKFKTRNKRMYLLIGTGFLGAAFFDWLQALTTNFTRL